jgi:hypothetical protein
VAPNRVDDVKANANVKALMMMSKDGNHLEKPLDRDYGAEQHLGEPPARGRPDPNDVRWSHSVHLASS